MAVPATMTTLDLSGKFTQNKEFSADTSGAGTKILEAQGVPPAVAAMLKDAQISLTLKHSADKLVMEQGLVGMPTPQGPPSVEERVLDGVERESNSGMFGAMLVTAKRVAVADLPEGLEMRNWTKDTQEKGVILIDANSDAAKTGKKWLSSAAWGIVDVKGDRRLARRISFTMPGEEVQYVNLVFDYDGPAA